MKILTIRSALFLCVLFIWPAFGSSLDQAYNGTVRVEQITAAYHENAVAAHAKYGGAHIILAGKVESVGKDHDGDPFIILGPYTSGSGHVRCKFSEIFNPRIATLKRDFSINVRGTVVSNEGSNIVTLKDCSL